MERWVEVRRLGDRGSGRGVRPRRGHGCATVRLPVQRCPRFIENSSHMHMNFSRARFLVDYNARVDSKEMETMTFEHPQPFAWEVQNEHVGWGLRRRCCRCCQWELG